MPKARMTFDGTITLRNSDGVNEVPSSSANHLEIQGLSWTGVHVAVADNMTHREDGLIGNGLFQDKVLEIDYDRMVLAVHATLPALSAEWTRQDIFLDGGVVPFVRGSLSVGDAARAGWFMLDTGAYTSILNSDRLSPVSKFAGELRRLLGPLGGYTFSDTNYTVRRFDGDASRLGLMGNDVLKRFKTTGKGRCICGRTRTWPTRSEIRNARWSASCNDRGGRGRNHRLARPAAARGHQALTKRGRLGGC